MQLQSFALRQSILVGSVVQREVTEPPGSAPDSAEMSPEQYREFLLETLGNGARASAEGAIHFVCVDWRRIGDLIEVGRRLYGEMLNLVVWDKTSAGPGSPYRSQHEPIGVFRVGREPGQNNAEFEARRSQSVGRLDLSGPQDDGQEPSAAPAADPARQPVALVADALLDCTAKGEIVLDPFAGSGATILAAEKVARRAYALEREARFVDVAIQRWRADDQT